MEELSKADQNLVSLLYQPNAGTIEELSPHLQLWAQTSQHRCLISGREKFIGSSNLP